MTPEERLSTIRNVISDLTVYAERLESMVGSDHYAGPDVDDVNEVWFDAKCSCEYIIHDVPHL